MNQVEMGRFIAALRREQGLTQEALGRRIGVTNKTVSHWENGNYMPDVETLQILSGIFRISMEALLCGQRLESAEGKDGGEQISDDMRKSNFSIEEKIAFWKRKWLREHTTFLVLSIAAILFLFVAGSSLLGVWLFGSLPFVMLVWYAMLRNRCIIYIERRMNAS